MGCWNTFIHDTPQLLDASNSLLERRPLDSYESGDLQKQTCTAGQKDKLSCNLTKNLKRPVAEVYKLV